MKKFIFTAYGDPPHKWELISDTPEDRFSAIQNGAKHFTAYSFSQDPKQNDHVIRYGDITMDFDSKDDPLLAVKTAQDFVGILHARFGVNPDDLRFWLSGNKGCHLSIPASLFGGEEGDPELPIIHREMLFRLTDGFSNQYLNHFDLIDQNLYKMGQGQLVRIENIRRANGHYKVPVTAAVFMNISEKEQMDVLTSEPWSIDDYETPKRNDDFHEFYLECLRHVKTLKVRPIEAAPEASQQCRFLQYCKENAAGLKRAPWIAMLSNMVQLGAIGRELAHTYSSSYPNYTPEETESQLRSLQSKLPYSCEKIKKEIWDCGCSCNVKFPYLLSTKNKEKKTNAIGNFYIQDDGVYRIAPDNSTPTKVCSYVEVEAITHDEYEESWGRLVKLKTPNGHFHEIVIPQTDLYVGTDVVSKLAYMGVQIEPYRKAQDFFVEFLKSCYPSVYATVVRKYGWFGSVYVLKNANIGNNLGERIVYDGNSREFPMNISGTLEDWKENVGKLCKGQKLFQLAICYAFTGILLTPCGYEGGGLHFVGLCSSGKTTLLKIAGSLYGGGPKGYLALWRGTDNGFEGLASIHNDGFMCLDEIGQASSKVIDSIAYMFANGQAKIRAYKDGMKRTQQTWSVAFISSGELTLSAKIEQEVGKQAMVGQQVRVIDIPADAGAGYKTLSYIPEGYTAESLSSLLGENALLYYGTPAMTFIEKFAEDFEENVSWIKSRVNQFVDTNCIPEASSQVFRVCKRFGLAAAAGELAIKWGILPWSEGDGIEAVKFGFDMWIKQRGGYGDLELTNVIDRLKNFISLNEHRFFDLDSGDYRAFYNIAGVCWMVSGIGYKVYGIFPNIFDKEVCCTTPRKEVTSELQKLGYMLMTSKNKPVETKEKKNFKERIIAIVPKWKEDINEETNDKDEYDIKRIESEDNSNTEENIF